MDIIKLWLVFTRQKDYSRDCTGFNIPYIDIHHSIYSTENEAKKNKKYGQSYKEVVAVYVGDNKFLILGAMEDAMNLRVS
jgi:hypothetical protein